jgi:hypothetical protein
MELITSRMEARVVADLPIECPAGTPLGEESRGAGCRCRITDSNVTTGADPSTLIAHCMSEDGYLECPVWKDDRERAWARRESLVVAA